MADAHHAPQLGLAPTSAGGNAQQQPVAAAVFPSLMLLGSQQGQIPLNASLVPPSALAAPQILGSADQQQQLTGLSLGMQANSLSMFSPQQTGSSASCNPQALMGVLNLLQQNIGALQALVPLLAGQQTQQVPMEQQQLAASGMVNTISQLASATASVIPQLGMVMQPQQQPQLQAPLFAPAPVQSHAPAGAIQQTPLARTQHSEHPLNFMTESQAPTQREQDAGNGLALASEANVGVAVQHDDWKGYGKQQLKEELGREGGSGSGFKLAAERVNPGDSQDGEDGDENTPGDDDFPEENLPAGTYDIVEMDPMEILAEHTHFCEICGKGFKRDANLRMHMRGHGDEYKTPSALARPDKQSSDEAGMRRTKRYSCPYIGCKRNKLHRRFTPLKTMLCVKNHYRRSHCPKMLTCSKCGVKRFSVVADLRTHEKHCGKDRWLCSCGTTFSRKDKLLGHLALFVGHSAAVPTEGEDTNGSPALGGTMALKSMGSFDPAPATSASGTGAIGGGRARDCVSSTFNLNQPTEDDGEVEREVIVYGQERPVTIVRQSESADRQSFFQQRLPIRTANYLGASFS